jgi:succinate dehydrogenase / fumarate reductase, cytochrome b subunit
MVAKAERPISPHLGVYRRGVHMMASITHRATGFVLASAGMVMLLWWLSAIGGGEESYNRFIGYFTGTEAEKESTALAIACMWAFRLVLLGITYSFFQHLFSGIRHLLMDMGAGFELNTNRTSAWLVYIAAITSTGAVALLVFNYMLKG